LYYTEPESLIAETDHINSKILTVKRGLRGILLNRVLLVVCLLLMGGVMAFGQTNYYSKAAGNLDALGSWGLNADGSGAPPASFANANQIFNIRNNPTPTIGLNWTVSGVGSMVIIGDGTNPCVFTVPNPNRVFTATTIISNNGTLRITSTAATPYSGTLTVNSGGTYDHARDGGAIPIATWNALSNCNITGITGTELTANLTQTFGNFRWNCPGQTILDRLNGMNGITIAGDFYLINTGSGSIRLGSNTGRSFSILGDFNVSGGTYNLTTGSSPGTIYLSGDFNMNGGTITETGSNSGNIVFDNTSVIQNFRRSGGTISNTINFTVNSGVIIDFDANDHVDGLGTFTLNSGATLQTANPLGINGSIQTITLPSLSTSANYTFDGTAAQFTGSYLPATINNLTFDNLAGVSLTNSESVNDSLTLTSGTLNLNGRTLTITTTGLVSCGGTGTINGNAGSVYIINSTINNYFPVGTYNDVTKNGISVINTCGNATINGTLNILNGTFNVVDGTLTLNGPPIAGNPMQFAALPDASLIFGGTSAGTFVPASVNTLSNLSIYNSNNSVSLYGNLTLGGTLDPQGAGLSIGAHLLTLNGQINCGFLTGGPSSEIYIGGAGTAFLSAVVLNNLTINRASGVTLCGDVTVNNKYCN
jgi:hypothetical protein